MNSLKVVNICGVEAVDSREVAEMIGMRHTDLLRKISNYKQVLENAKFRFQDFFISSTYKVDGNNKTYDCYLLTKKGCEMVANKLTGEKGVLFTAQYVEVFNDMKRQLNIGNYPSKSTSIGEVTRLLTENRKIMSNNQSTSYDIAKQSELILKQFGIKTIDNYCNDKNKKPVQLALAFIPDDIR